VSSRNGASRWAEHINLYGNAGAHPETYGEVSMDEARDVALLLRSLFDAVYVLPGNIKKDLGLFESE
jgi:hypothetical protein